MSIGCPFSEFDLGNEKRFDPNATFHFFPRERPLRAPFFRQVVKWAGVGLEALESPRDITAHMRYEPVAHLGDVNQPVTVVISDDEGIKRTSGSIAADDKLLPLIELVFNPGAAPFSRLIFRVSPFADDSF